MRKRSNRLGPRLAGTTSGRNARIRAELDEQRHKAFRIILGGIQIVDAPEETWKVWLAVERPKPSVNRIYVHVSSMSQRHPAFCERPAIDAGRGLKRGQKSRIALIASSCLDPSGRWERLERVVSLEEAVRSCAARGGGDAALHAPYVGGGAVERQGVIRRILGRDCRGGRLTRLAQYLNRRIESAKFLLRRGAGS